MFVFAAFLWKFSRVFTGTRSCAPCVITDTFITIQRQCTNNVRRPTVTYQPQNRDVLWSIKYTPSGTTLAHRTICKITAVVPTSMIASTQVNNVWIHTAVRSTSITFALGACFLLVLGYIHTLYHTMFQYIFWSKFDWTSSSARELKKGPPGSSILKFEGCKREKECTILYRLQTHKLNTSRQD